MPTKLTKSNKERSALPIFRWRSLKSTIEYLGKWQKLVDCEGKGNEKTQNEQISNEIFVFPLNFFLFLIEKPPKIWYCRNLGVYLQEKEVIWT